MGQASALSVLWVRRLHGEKSAAIDHFNTHSISAFVTAGSKMLPTLLLLNYLPPLLLPRPRLPSLLLPSLLLPALLLPALCDSWQTKLAAAAAVVVI